MSKVREGYNNPHEKSKMRRNLRRKETVHKKNDRITKAKNGTYGFPKGYYIIDEKLIPEYELVDVPETTSPVYEYSYERIMHTEYIDGEAYEYPIIIPIRKYIGDKVIPAHKKRHLIANHFVDIPERPIRINVTKKFYKKYGNRKVRRSNDIYKYGDYKKVYDVAWNLC